MYSIRAAGAGVLVVVLLAAPGVSGAAGGVPCATATSPRAAVVAARDVGVQPRSRGPLFLGSFDIVIHPGATLAANAAALAAFNRAAEQWEAYISDPITVDIDADLDSLGFPGPLGVTLNTLAEVDYTTIRDAVVADAAAEADDGIVAALPTAAQLALLYPPGYSFNGDVLITRPNLLALGIPPGALPGPSITFNSDYPFDFDNSDGVAAGKYDLESVAAHEIGHALGFSSTTDEIDGGPAGAYPLGVLDFFRFQNGTANDPATAAQFTTLPRGQVPGDDEVTDDIDGESRMSTGMSGGDGRQAGHWKADELTGTYIGLMDPTIASGTVEPLTNADLRALDLIGYQIVSGAITTTTTTLPPPICGATPHPPGSCRLVTLPFKSSLQLKDGTDDAADSVKWTWASGAATALGDFKDPVGGTASMEFCVYDGSGSSQPRLGSRLLAGGTCGTKPCWKLSGPTGYALANKAGMPEGVTKAKYVSGAAGKAKVQIAGKGIPLPMPVLGLTLPVTVQLLIDDGLTTECWQTTYPAALLNDAATFRAKGP